MPRTEVHPGRNCGPCCLCGEDKQQYYAHPVQWNDINLMQRLLQFASNVDKQRLHLSKL